MRRKVDPAESMRRLRYGDIRTFMCDRWGTSLPPGAGRNDLRLLLLYVSAGEHAHLRMPREIRQWAPWMTADAAQELIDDVNRTPHLPTARQLGEQLGVTNAIRERLAIWRITACDMTARQAREWQKRKRKDRERRRREARGSKGHRDSISRTKPWKSAGFNCRSTWERHGKPPPVPQIRAQSSSTKCRKFVADNASLNTGHESAAPEQAAPPQARANDHRPSNGRAATKAQKPESKREVPSVDARARRALGRNLRQGLDQHARRRLLR